MFYELQSQVLNKTLLQTFAITVPKLTVDHHIPPYVILINLHFCYISAMTYSCTRQVLYLPQLKYNNFNWPVLYLQYYFISFKLQEKLISFISIYVVSYAVVDKLASVTFHKHEQNL